MADSGAPEQARLDLHQNQRPAHSLTANRLPETEYRARSVVLPIRRSRPRRCSVPITTTSTSNSLRNSWITGTGRPMTKRSDEHTSELQSLMRISYPVFCLKKKNNHHTLTT